MKGKKKRKIKKKAIVLIVLIIVLLLLVTGLVIFTKKGKGSELKPTKVENEISEYGYILESNQTKLYKSLFKDLRKVLESEEIDYDEYAKIISQMAAADFYTLNNKSSKNDVGAVQFIKKENQENFILQSSETVYKYIEHNLDGKRKQELPEVVKTEVKDLKNDKYSYKDIKDDKAYVIKVKLEYKKDLDYPEEVEIRLLHTDKKLEIYYMK